MVPGVLFFTTAAHVYSRLVYIDCGEGAVAFVFPAAIKPATAYERRGFITVLYLQTFYMFRSPFMIIFRDAFLGRVYYKDNQTKVKGKIQV